MGIMGNKIPCVQNWREAIFTNEIDVDISSGILINEISDNLPIFSIMRYVSNVGKSNDCNYKFIRRLKYENMAKLK